MTVATNWGGEEVEVKDFAQRVHSSDGQNSF